MTRIILKLFLLSVYIVYRTRDPNYGKPPEEDDDNESEEEETSEEVDQSEDSDYGDKKKRKTKSSSKPVKKKQKNQGQRGRKRLASSDEEVSRYIYPCGGLNRSPASASHWTICVPAIGGLQT